MQDAEPTAVDTPILAAKAEKIAQTQVVPDSIVPEVLQPWMPLIQSITVALIIFLVGWLVSKWGARLARVAVRRAKVDEALARFLSEIARYTILAATGIAALGAVGIQTTSLVAVFASAGLAVGLALQGSLSSFAAGVLVLFFRPFQLGDAVKVAGETGTVDDIGIFATVLLTPDNHRVTIPNSSVTNGNIVNYTKMGTRRASIAVGVAYGSDLDAVIRTTLDACKTIDTVIADPEPSLYFAGMGASSLDFTLYYWTTSADWWATQTRVRRAVHDALVAAGVDIPFDQLVVHRAEGAA